MILFEPSPTAAVRSGEFEVGSRRIAARAFPYAGEGGGPRFRFDPVERRFFARSAEGTVVVGPHDADHWRTALLRGLAGPVLVGPGSPAEEIRGAYRAAAEGARLSGRAVYLLDPDRPGLPDPPGRPFTALFSWFPGLPDCGPGLVAAREKGIAAGCVLPLVAGWTALPGFVSGAARRAAAAGAEFLAGVALYDDGLARRTAYEAAAAASPETADGLFEGIHHAAPGQTREALELLREACSREGIASAPPRPVGSREPVSNAAAAARLEEMAGEAAGDEHRAALIHAAARWLDEMGRDLAPIAREGNLSKVFPFGAELARDVQEALLAAAP